VNYLHNIGPKRSEPPAGIPTCDVTPVEQLLNQLGEALAELDSRVVGLKAKLVPVLTNEDARAESPVVPAPACKLEEVLIGHLGKLHEANSQLSALLRTLRI
jgi:hypothetical protein